MQKKGMIRIQQPKRPPRRGRSPTSPKYKSSPPPKEGFTYQIIGGRLVKKPKVAS